MATYIMLMKLTEQGIKDIKNAPQRIEQGSKAVEAMGGKLLGFYSVMGDYDYVAIGETPSEEVMMTFLLGLGSLGNIRTTTLRAFNREEFATMVKKLP
ncbi:MAG TPA: GYD domain-containing protein [Dehalococcoidia bacterium]|nr:GYD domain-containing protein [Dehalococcoidia bacterium]